MLYKKVHSLFNSYKFEYLVGSGLISLEVDGDHIRDEEREIYAESMDKTNGIIHDLINNFSVEEILSTLSKCCEDYIFSDDFDEEHDDIIAIESNLNELIISVSIENTLFKKRSEGIPIYSSMTATNEVNSTFYDLAFWFIKNYRIDEEETEKIKEILSYITLTSFPLRHNLAGNKELKELLSNPDLFNKMSSKEPIQMLNENLMERCIDSINSMNLDEMNDGKKIFFILMTASLLLQAEKRELELPDDTRFYKSSERDVKYIHDIVRKYQKELNGNKVKEKDYY